MMAKPLNKIDLTDDDLYFIIKDLSKPYLSFDGKTYLFEAGTRYNLIKKLTVEYVKRKPVKKL
jgi:hypothetical protein